MLNPLTQPAGPLKSKQQIETHAEWLGLRRRASTPGASGYWRGPRSTNMSGLCPNKSWFPGMLMINTRFVGQSRPQWRIEKTIVGNAFRLPSGNRNYYRDLFLLCPFLLFAIAGLLHAFAVTKLPSHSTALVIVLRTVFWFAAAVAIWGASEVF
jgi:hypothetical protein